MKKLTSLLIVMLFSTGPVWAQEAAEEEKQPTEEATTEETAAPAPAEEAPKAEEPQPEEAPEAQPAEANEEKAVEEAPVAEEAPATEAPATEAPATEAPATEEAVPAEETPATEEAPVVEPTPVVEEAPATETTETIEAVSVDSDEAKNKIDAFTADQPVATETLSATVDAKEDDETPAPFSAMIVMEHAVGSGTFVKNDFIAGQKDYVVQSWDIRPTYNFQALGHQLKTGARILFDTEFTEPENNTGKRFNLADSSIYLSDGKLYKEPITDITLAGNVRWFFPTSPESRLGTTRWGAFRAGLSLSRSIGPFDLSYGFGYRKNFHFETITQKKSDTWRESDAIRDKDTSGEAFISSGYANTSFDLQNTLGVDYSPTEELTVSASLTFWQRFKYNAFPERDEFTPSEGDVGRERGADMLWPSLEVSYALSAGLKRLANLDLPVKLNLAMGITSLHPAQSDNNEDIIWPLFYNTFGSNRAANNYGQVYFDIIGSYSLGSEGTEDAK